MKVMEADKVVPLCRLLLFGNPEADEIAREMKCIVDSLTFDTVSVVRCKDCVSHGNCLTEDTFRIAGIQNPYCCGGKRKESDT